MRTILTLGVVAWVVAVLVVLSAGPAGQVAANPGDPYADTPISISRVTSGTNIAGASIDTSWDDGDNGSDATGAPDWAGNQTPDKITTLGIDEKSDTDPSNDDRGSVVLAFTDNVCLDGTGPDLYIYDAWGAQSLNGNESADIEVSNDGGVTFVAAGSVGPGAYDLDISGALPFFTRVRVTATDFAGQLTLAALDLDAVECLHSVDIGDISLSADPSSDVNAIGTEHMVTATLSPAIEGVEVTFTITGPNSAESGTADTSGSGVASFTYTGSSAGIDSIVASVTFEGTTIQATAVTKTWYDKFVSGGGQLLEEAGPKRPQWNVISFGGFAAEAGTGNFIGEWQVNFHNVGDVTFDSTSFHTTSIDDMNFFVDGGGCIAMNFTATGVWNGTPDYEMILRAEDAGEPGKLDNVRIQLFNSSSVEVYDTHDGDFTDQSNCFGTARTYLDNGNLQMAVLTP
jgi:hypothetical protein